MRISDWSSDVCSSDLPLLFAARQLQPALADLAFIAMGQAHDQSVDGRAARRRFHLGPGRAVPPIADRKSVVLGKECVSTCRSRWSPYHSTKQLTTTPSNS